MTEIEISIEQREGLLASIVEAHLRSELVGESETMQTARTLMHRYLLGPTLPTEAAPRPAPALPPLTIPVSPDTPVEAVPGASEETVPLRDGVPGFSRSGEKQEEGGESLPPAPPVKRQRRVKATAPAPLPEMPSAPLETVADFDGPAAATCYIEECCTEKKPVNANLVGSYLGITLASDIRKFIHTAQDNWNRTMTGRAEGFKGKQKQREAIAQGFANLAARLAEGDDEEPDDEELSAFETAMHPLPTPSRRPQTMAKREQEPHWWQGVEKRTCRACGAVLMPHQKSLPNGKQRWEAPSNYALRSYCPEHSPKTGGKQIKACEN